MRVQFPVTIFIKYMSIGADQTAGKRNNYFNLHCGFKSHHGNPKEDIRHCLQDYHIERVQVLKKIKREYILLNTKERSKTKVKNIRKKIKVNNSL